MNDVKPLREAISAYPPAFDREAAIRLRDIWGGHWSQLTSEEAFLLEGVAGCSPFLRRIMERDPQSVIEILGASFDENMDCLCSAVTALGDLPDGASAMQPLRQLKSKAALSIALADIASAVDTMIATRAISKFADAAVGTALRLAARQADLESVNGLSSIAMGKLGAHELNYSSDIDLIFVFDPHAMACGDNGAAKQKAVRVVRDMVAILQNQTADGYVFRTDLRLRPDPGVTPLALSVEAAEAYYESYGQNWERMAFIKARAHAGDQQTGEKFLNALRPFIWRKYLDFASIEDVQAVKRQIHSSKGGHEIDFAGHDLKTGRGGIREIEFFAQTQQIILGGKDPSLRSRSTLDALDALLQAEQISQKQRDDLRSAYYYLRHVEHRLQMVNDEQTHTIPKSPNDIARAAMFVGEKDAIVFEEKIVDILKLVQSHYDDLFRDDTVDVDQPGPLVFTGVDADKATLKTLEELGFTRTEEISAVIRRWHTGGLRATKTERARVILTKLMAPLLLSLSKASDPDAAFFAFDDFLSHLPAGVQVFSLLANNVSLFDSLTRLIGIAPFLGREMSRRGNFVETLLEHGLTASLPETVEYEAELHSLLASADDYEQHLNVVRRWAGEAKFLVAAKIVIGDCTSIDAGHHLTAIAEVAISAIVPAVEAEMNRLHGSLDGALTVIAMGRLGAGEMTVASDIDIMFIYDAPEGAISKAQKENQRSLGAPEYFSRLVRRLITALSAATEEGALYEVDMALRPSGRAGPAAVSFSAFQKYYETDAWTWEVMALTKARVITGEHRLGNRVNEEIDTIFNRSRNKVAVAKDVRDMRQRLIEAKPPANIFDVKKTSGGLTDIEFIVQYLAIISENQKARIATAPAGALASFCELGLIDKADADQLIAVYRLLEDIFHVSRAATGGIFDPESSGQALSDRIAEICDVETLAESSELLQKKQAQVLTIYERVLGP